jgi:hypothetical protein
VVRASIVREAACGGDYGLVGPRRIGGRIERERGAYRPHVFGAEADPVLHWGIFG